MMRLLVRASLLLVLGLGGLPAEAAAPRLFQAGSLAEIRQHYQGRPFVLALWSLTCSHCARELTHFAELKRNHPDFNLVVVSTDTPEEAAALTSALAGYGLGAVESWVFADDFSERLRHAIDPQWGGELPRAYLYDAGHQRRGFSGRIPDAVLDDWLTVQTGRPDTDPVAK